MSVHIFRVVLSVKCSLFLDCICEELNFLPRLEKNARMEIGCAERRNDCVKCLPATKKKSTSIFNIMLLIFSVTDFMLGLVTEIASFFFFFTHSR